MPRSRPRPPEDISHVASEETNRAIPDIQSSTLPLLERAGDINTHRLCDAVDLLADRLRLTEDERRERMSERQESRAEERAPHLETGGCQISAPEVATRRGESRHSGSRDRNLRIGTSCRLTKSCSGSRGPASDGPCDTSSEDAVAILESKPASNVIRVPR